MSRVSFVVVAVWLLALQAQTGASSRLPFFKLLTAADGSELRTSGPLDRLCDICTKVTGQVHSILTNPKFAFDLMIAVESQICSHLGDVEAKCKETVEKYVPKILFLLVYALSYENMCRKTHICDTNGEKDIQDCLACKLVVKILRHKLTDPDAQEKLMQLVLERCAALLNEDLAAECSKAVHDILPVIFQKLPSLLDPKTLCQRLGLCKGAASSASASATASLSATASSSASASASLGGLVAQA